MHPTVPLIAILFGSVGLSASLAGPATQPSAPSTTQPDAQPASRPTTQPSLFDPARHMRIDEVKPGMKGYGLTVFQGQTVEKFEVSVIDVQRNFGLRQDVVLIRCLGDRLEHTGVIAGMSGSPIFLTDDQGRSRMIGALAYGWPLAKDPFAGVQPIEYMLDLPTRAPTTAPTAKASAAGNLRWQVEPAIAQPTGKQQRALSGLSPHAPEIRADLPERNGDVALPGAKSDLAPLATPLMIGGLSPEVIRELIPLLKATGLVPLQAGGASIAPPGMNNTIVPGSALVVPLVTGDLDITALGTCTEVLGDRIYGFGHPFNNEGQVSLPLAAGYVTTVIPTLTSSFKLGGMTQIVGTLASDQSVGIAGESGVVPKMIPVDLTVTYADGSSDRTFHFNIISHPQLTPLLGTVVLSSALASQNQLPTYNTVDLNLSIEFENGKSVAVRNSAVNASDGDLFFDIGAPIISAGANPFQQVLAKKITGRMVVSSEAREATILDVNVPRTRYLPGETVKAFVTYRPFRGPETVLPVEMTIPTDLPDGTYSLTISDWRNYLMQERQSEPFRFTTENVDQVFAVLQEIADVRRNALYVRLMRQADGVAVGRAAMSRLPASRRRVLLDAGRSNTTAFVSSTVKVVPSKYVFSGDATFEIEVDHNAHADRPRKHQADVKPAASAGPTSAPGS
jgi:hypothetical protein